MGAFLEWDPSHGIPLLRCCQGTNLVECVDRQYNTTFRHKAGIEMGDAQISERRHRHNLDMAQQVYRDFPKVGHYDTWKIDVLQKLVGQNTGKLLYPGWTCFSCNSWGVPLPFLPVMRRVEYRLFSQLMLNDLQKFDENRMSHLWIAHVNGQGIFPKLPVQLKKYHQHWERNRRIQDAMERAKSEIELMNSYLAKKVPMEFKDGSNTVEGAFAETDEEVELVDGEPGIGLGRELQHDDITPPAQQGNVVGNVNRVHFNPQADSSNAPLPTGTKKIKITNNNEMYMDMPEAQLYRLYPQHFGQYSQNRFICNVKTLKKTIREVREANALKQSCPGGENYKRKRPQGWSIVGQRFDWLEGVKDVTTTSLNLTSDTNFT
ncbi:hypothetical protein IV203_001637 [Nitzschia inconspicua]|uniref:Uncharacterized protein n=1 Tax=Nitzschia inconspicua TaxID=303405 RepID=A0A9K3L815_9STRA|nr:hypothetical protein IV203_001637 [Nitzschia inconspicua]